MSASRHPHCCANIVLLAVSPFIVGLIRKVKARLQCRRGASVFQPYADLGKLFRKQPVVSTTTSWIFTATPYILFASTLTAGLLVPSVCSPGPAELCRQYYRARLSACAGNVFSDSWRDSTPARPSAGWAAAVRPSSPR